ncbi:MAG: gluconolaconase [Acidobacteria bacterium]|nr:MAG: gluconolaconase [Acidobacteriota bacterium]
MPPPRTPARVVPPGAVEGGRLTIAAGPRPFDVDPVAAVHVGDGAARVVAASSARLAVLVPAGLTGGRVPVTVAGDAEPAGQVEIGRLLAADLHQVDSPAYDPRGVLYTTFSGNRGQRVAVSVFRVHPDGSRDPFVSGIVNATSLAFDPDGRLCVTSRFDGSVYRIDDTGTPERIASDLGVACGLAFSPDGSFFVGDRTGTLFRVNAAGRVTPFATLPPSVAAFHLALGLHEEVFVTGPTLSARDAIYRVDRRGEVRVFAEGFGRPQGMAIDADGQLYVAEALAGASGIYRVRRGGRHELVVAGSGLVGLALHPSGGMAVVSRENAWFLSA